MASYSEDVLLRGRLTQKAFGEPPAVLFGTSFGQWGPNPSPRRRLCPNQILHTAASSVSIERGVSPLLDSNRVLFAVPHQSTCPPFLCPRTDALHFRQFFQTWVAVLFMMKQEVIIMTMTILCVGKWGFDILV